MIGDALKPFGFTGYACCEANTGRFEPAEEGVERRISLGGSIDQRAKLVGDDRLPGRPSACREAVVLRNLLNSLQSFDAVILVRNNFAVESHSGRDDMYVVVRAIRMTHEDVRRICEPQSFHVATGCDTPFPVRQ
jgi:hypothetical protein